MQSLSSQQLSLSWTTTTTTVAFVATAYFAHWMMILRKKHRHQQQQQRIYLDYNATTPIDPRVYQAMIPFLTNEFGNPSSTNHWAGHVPAASIHNAREQVLQLLGLAVDNDPTSAAATTTTPRSAVWFTASGTEADNWAIALALQNAPQVPPHIVTTNVEHPAIAHYLEHLQNLGRCRVTYVPVNAQGQVEAEQVIQAITKFTCLVTIQYANNETGAVQPVVPIAKYCRQHDILFHTDAAQAAGKVSMLFSDQEGPDMVTLVGHKMGAPKGVGCLYVRPGCLQQEVNLLWGGGQEYGRRGGTENVPYLVGFGTACALAAQEWQNRAVQMEAMRTLLLQLLTEGLGVDNVQANGPTDPSLRLPNTLSVGIKNVQAGALLQAVGDRVAASAGASCHTPQAHISAVLQAMKVPTEFALGTIRLSVSHTTTKPEIEQAAAILIAAVQEQWAANKVV
ncbi:cysteine desulfurase [Fistulifera solaris]|uniref:Cysteine desulfurase n=1 Tax=Fistulifera solaris TaxID=1519565 RepID=A0A1Z5KCV9_FISSO|nr:cysteine desulfurase [Fistulifera solaris]|eukprot:GAX23962.1 cysteine desulfurase [Fistulifera solaris]